MSRGKSFGISIRDGSKEGTKHNERNSGKPTVGSVQINRQLLLCSRQTDQAVTTSPKRV